MTRIGNFSRARFRLHYQQRNAGCAVAVIIIDKRPLFRDCMVQCLKSSYPDWRIEAFANVTEWKACPDATALSNILVICVSENRTIDPEVRRELSQLGAENNTPPALIVSDTENFHKISLEIETYLQQGSSRDRHTNALQDVVATTKAGRILADNQYRTGNRLPEHPFRNHIELEALMKPQSITGMNWRTGRLRLRRETTTVRMRKILRSLPASDGTDSTVEARNNVFESRASPHAELALAKGRPMIIPSGKLRVVVIDPQRLRRAGLVQLLGGWANANGLELNTFPTPDVTDIGPDCAIVVLNVGGTSVREQEWQLRIKRIRAAAPDIPLAVLSDRDDRNEILAAFGVGVTGFIATNFDPPLALEALSFLLHGGSFFPLTALLDDAHDRQIGTTHIPDTDDVPDTNDVAAAMSCSFNASAMPGQYAIQESRAGAQFNSTLTPRQSEVLNHLREGKSNKLIARELKMTEATVKVHVRQIMRKFGAINRTQVVLRATEAYHGSADTPDAT